MDKDFLIQTYAQCYGPEAGPWNVSVENKYQEYLFAKFFQDHFPVEPGTDICNIGIGAGYWDRFLSYQLKSGRLVSIDRDELCCRQLGECLKAEENPNPVEIICADVMSVNLQNQFPIVTMVGSTAMESGMGERILEKAMSMVARGGSLYYQSLDPAETSEAVERVGKNMKVESYLREQTGELTAQFWKLTKE